MIKVMESKRVKWAVHVARIGSIRNRTKF